MAKKDPKDLSVEDKLKHLYQLQTTLSAIDEKRALRGELPLEVRDLEDEIAGLNTRIDKIRYEEFQKMKKVTLENVNSTVSPTIVTVSCGEHKEVFQINAITEKKVRISSH